MDLGVVFPTTQIGSDPAVIREYAQTAEALGYRRILVYDHVLGAVHEDRESPLPGPYTPDHPFHEPMVLLGFLAACTTTIELQCGVLVLPQRQTALVAKQTAEIDVLSQGRLVVSAGTGWNYVEYEALGVPWADRGKRLDEQVEVLRRLWSEPVVDFRGDYHRIDRAGIAPRPVRGTIPLYFGGGGEPSLRRAARIGDGFTFGSAGQHTHDNAARLRDLLVEQGRDADAFPIETMIDHSLGEAEWAEQARRWPESGGSLLALRTMSTGAGYHGVPAAELPDPAAHIQAMHDFMRVVRG